MSRPTKEAPDRNARPVTRQEITAVMSGLAKISAAMAMATPTALADVSPEMVVTDIKRGFDVADAVRETVVTRHSADLRSAMVAQERAVRAFANFSPSTITSVARQKGGTFLVQGADLPALQASVIRDDLSTLATREPKKGLRLRITDEEHRAMRHQFDTGVRLDVQYASKVADACERASLAGAIAASYSPLAECLAEVTADERLEELTRPPSLGPPTDLKPVVDDVALDAFDRDELVQGQVGLQMRNATAPEERVVFGVDPRATTQDLQKAIESFELRTGPADVTSSHDFHDLQIAFRHVWTELFDGHLKSLGQKLFAEAVRLHGEVGAGDIPPVVTSKEQLNQLVEDLNKTRLTVAENDPRLAKVRDLIPEVTLENWARLDEPTKKSLYEYAVVVAMLSTINSAFSWMDTSPFRNSAKALYDAQCKALASKSTKPTRVEHFLDDLEQRLKEKYAFHVFAPDSYNFGLLVTYRQEWKPLKYQVGDLVSTIPLAPKETRRYTTRRVVKKTRAEKEIEDALQIRREESATTSRADAEIVLKALNKTNFKHNAEGGVNFLVWNAKASHSIATESGVQSSQVKHEFREAVLKAAQEYKAEHRMELDLSAAEELETTTSGEISNPNDELPVTFLFYELQRSYEISEKIHKLRPVIMVANPVPHPHEIDEAWLMSHDWILRRAILDDSFKKGLDYLSQTFVGDEVSVEVVRNHWSIQLEVVEKIVRQVVSHEGTFSAVKETLNEAVEKYSETLVKGGGGLFSAIGDFLFGGSKDETDKLRVQMEAAKEAFARAERDLTELRSQLGREVTALEGATDKYAQALERQFDRRTEILRLRAHIKDNILYYMQAIWDQEPPDQRFFRMYDQIEVPVFDLHDFPIKAYPWTGGLLSEPHDGTQMAIFKFLAPMFGGAQQPHIEMKKLVEVADLDNPLGYKGNYVIFPLKVNHAITTFLMQDYLELHEIPRLVDPDEVGALSTDELKSLIKCMVKRNPAALDDQSKARLRDALIKRLSDPHPEREVVIVPTTSLYIEALPGTHPILEDFKLVHRAVDVKKVQAEVRHVELENVRLAARVLHGVYEDADIEKKIVVEGGSTILATDNAGLGGP